MKSYKDLIVWQKSRSLCKEIYLITQKFPKSEMYGLTSQMRRSALAIPTNIAEGQKRDHKLKYIQFIRIAYSSGVELETQLIIAFDISYLKKEEYQRLFDFLEEIMKMLNKLLQKLKYG